MDKRHRELGNPGVSREMENYRSGTGIITVERGGCVEIVGGNRMFLYSLTLALPRGRGDGFAIGDVE